MTHLTYLQAAVVGLVQGVTELFPISSLGHAVLIPAVIGGQWAQNLNVAAESSPYLAFIVGLHVATAAALLIYFREDWVRIIRGLGASIRYREVYTADERLAWMIVLGTIPVGIAGLALQKTFQTVFGQPKVAAVFLTINGLILIAGERFRRHSSREADEETARQREFAELAVGRHSAGARADRQREHTAVAMSDGRLASLSYPQALFIGSAQILALIAGISRDGVAMVAGMTRGLSREDAAGSRSCSPHRPSSLPGCSSCPSCSARQAPGSAARSWSGACWPGWALIFPSGSLSSTCAPAHLLRSASTASWPAWAASPT